MFLWENGASFDSIINKYTSAPFPTGIDPRSPAILKVFTAFNSSVDTFNGTILEGIDFSHSTPLVHPNILNGSSGDIQAHPRTQSGRRALVYGLPPEWTAVFQTVTSIQPPLITPAFVQFFSTAAKLAAADPVPGRRVQRIPFGALVLEFIANDNQNQLVTKEFVEAASLWLLDAAQKGWTGLFKAWVVDKADGEVVFVRLTNVWDELMSLSF
ncbi:MAG: hypothetical protein ASARMPRED_005333 [Alectoria sarmentosa]|nr:MAG: hypothetical protein ASARMPRED_005333 [Alectoria sarmentosa]